MKKYGAILADPPWPFATRSEKGKGRSPDQHYPTMTIPELKRMPVGDLAARDAVLFMWVTWPTMPRALELIEAWGFRYKTCAFAWMKADPHRLFADEFTPVAGLGYWTRSNSEVCLLATRGRPKRRKMDVRQGIISPRREHSRKPDEIYGRIERLVDGPYIELFARQRVKGWDAWGNEVDKFTKST